MKKIKKTVNLSEMKAVFKIYATDIVEILESKKVRMIKNRRKFHWQSYRDKEVCAWVDITIDNKPASVDLFIFICYPKLYKEMTYLETMIREEIENNLCKKYPLIDLHFSVKKDDPEVPTFLFKPSEDVAEQLYLTVTSYNKKVVPKFIVSKTKIIEKRVRKLIQKEAETIVKSFFG